MKEDDTEVVRMGIVESKNTYYLRNISTCCTVIAAYVVLRLIYWGWVVAQAILSMPIEP